MIFEICILAGGLSSRMGRDKAGVQLGGARLLTRIKWEAIKTGWPIRVLRRDAVERCGPVGGVYTALKRSQSDAVIFLACDMPFLSAAVIRRLTRLLTKGTNAVFAQAGGYAGFPFVLRTSLVDMVGEQIKAGRFSIQSLARATHARFMRVDARAVFDLDTPEDLTEARQRVIKEN